MLIFINKYIKIVKKVERSGSYQVIQNITDRYTVSYNYRSGDSCVTRKRKLRN